MQKIIVPKPLQITMDDLGWFCGKDGRKKMEPARTGISRRHCADDYETVNEIGRRLGMKINCAMIMGEWDPDNRLRHIAGLSPYGESWNNAAYFDKKEAERCAEVINSSPYIDIAVHGLQHSYYIPGGCYSNTDYYYLKDGEWQDIAENEIRTKIDAFFELLNHSGIKKPVNSFIPPNFVYKQGYISKILKDYDILYISTAFETMPELKKLSGAEVEEGIIVIDRNNNLIAWDEMESSLDKLPCVNGIFGCHWANVCHKNPSENYKLVDSWVNYFEKHRKNFGTILSKDIAFCATQTIYNKYSEISADNGCYTIDLKNLPKADGLKESFYISTGEPLTKWSGCDVEVYESCGEFINYKITPKSNILRFN